MDVSIMFLFYFGITYFGLILLKYLYFRYILGCSHGIIIDEINKDQIFFKVNNSYDK